MENKNSKIFLKNKKSARGENYFGRISSKYRPIFL